MAINVSGIHIVIKAFLPTGRTVDEQFEAFKMVKEAHESGDYAGVLRKAQIDEVKSEQKNRRVETEPPTMPLMGGAGSKEPDPEPTDPAEPEPDQPKTAAKRPA